MLIKELVRTGLNLHSISYPCCTPLTELVYGMCTFDIHNPVRFEIRRDQILPEMLSLWLECLQDSGVDLERYGRKEVEMHEEGLVSWNLGVLRRSSVVFTIKSLVYGPLPSDWKLQVEVALRPPVQSPKRGPQKMPGGWIEDE